jgi:hypothetical protein
MNNVLTTFINKLKNIHPKLKVTDVKRNELDEVYNDYCNSVKLFKNQDFRIVEDVRCGNLVLYKFLWEEKLKEWSQKSFKSWYDAVIALANIRYKGFNARIEGNGKEYLVVIENKKQ